jgi:hypothetical protein
MKVSTKDIFLMGSFSDPVKKSKILFERRSENGTKTYLWKTSTDNQNYTLFKTLKVVLPIASASTYHGHTLFTVNGLTTGSNIEENEALKESRKSKIQKLKMGSFLGMVFLKRSLPVRVMRNSIFLKIVDQSFLFQVTILTLIRSI